MISGVEKNLEQWTHMNVSYQEDIQILRYSGGETCEHAPISRRIRLTDQCIGSTKGALREPRI